MEAQYFKQNIEIPTDFSSFVKEVKNHQKSIPIEIHKVKEMSFLSSLSLDLKEFPDERTITAIFEANK